MAHINQLGYSVQIAPKPAPETRVSLSISPIPLENTGFTVPVSVSTPSTIRETNPAAVVRTETVMALFDTGASKTSIDIRLAELLGLSPVGISTSHTAAGPSESYDYAVDISFPGSNLLPFINLPIGSCKLPFQIGENGEIAINKTNFGLLIGRDIMSRWNIVWNGPTSTVFISD